MCIRDSIVVEGLRIGWGTRILMERVSFAVERGTTLAILGGSGSGKSTLLRYLIGLERPMAGRIDIVTHELPSIFLVADNCIVLDKEAKGIVARGDPRRLRDESEIPFVHNFFTRSSPGAAATEGR